MGEVDPTGLNNTLAQIQAQAQAQNLLITLHAHQKMVEEDVTLDEVLQAVATAQILERYPEHRRGACCLLSGVTDAGRFLHLVVTAGPTLIIITLYEPRPPKWDTPSRRRS